jgi:A/G-specific adenine glycosylase
MKRVVPTPAADGRQFADPSFSATVIAWQKRHGRHALPWQNTRDAYRIWLSEIMLQQTQVTAVIPYYQRFLQRFPDVHALAEAPVEDVMAHWSGLGYYTRARNLHRCARMVVEAYDGRFPADPEVLAQLPGIGRSTAAAIAAFAYGARAAILDGNVKRVFARVFGIDAYPGEKKVENALWLRADALLPQEGIEPYTQGLMDLGATICTRGRPACGRCPLAPRCVAFQTGRTSELPVRQPKKAVPEKHAAMLIIEHDGHVLLQQRPDNGIWGGLLSLPEVGGFVPLEGQVKEVPALTEQTLQQAVAPHGTLMGSERLPVVFHVFTHFRLHIIPYRVRLAKRLLMAAQDGHVWMPLNAMEQAPLPAPIKKLLKGIS